jgi:transcriptional regulator with XRE-family HTH domain
MLLITPHYAMFSLRERLLLKEKSMLGQRIRQRRLQLGLTQAQLEALSTVSQHHISSIEIGRIADVTGDTLRKLAYALRVTTDWLLDVPPPSRPYGAPDILPEPLP